MVFDFRILSPEDEDFFIEIEVDSSQTFFEFHNAIQNAVNYDKSQVTSFYVTNNEWEKELEISLMDMTGDPNSGVLIMDTTILKDYLKAVKDKLLYVYDFFNERAFFIELSKISEPQKGKTYPHIALLEGTPPNQYNFEDEGNYEDMIADVFNEFEADDKDIFDSEDMFDSDDIFDNEDLLDNIDDYEEFR